MITTETNEHHTKCDNCPARPKILHIVRGNDMVDEMEYNLSLCKRCVKKMGQEMLDHWTGGG